MATVGLYGSSSSGVVAAASGSESTGLYGNNVNFGGSYFEWFIFIQSDTQPATPTGGSWSFTTNSGTPPTGWSTTPFANPTNKIWVSIALVNSKNTSSLVWSEPGLFSYASGLPILSGASAPQPTDGQSDQLYIETGTTPETIWFKQAGTWTRLTGSSLYVDLTSNQTIAGTKTFSSTIQGSVSGTSNNVTGIVGIANGGTGSTTASGARTALGAAASGANSDITSLSGITNGISSPDYIQFDVNPTTVPTTPGALYWDTADGNQTLSLVMANGDAVQQIGEEQFYRIKASSAITNGQVVMFTGTVGASGALTGAPATGLTAATASYVMGIATQDIPLNGWGYVTSFGLVRKLDTSAFTAGQILYLDPAVPGGLTATLPVAPNPKVQVCACIYSSASNGSLFIRPSFGGILGQYEGDVDVTSVAAYNLLQRNSTNTKWTNVAGPAGAIVGTTDTQTLTNKTISGASNTLSNIGNSSLTNSSITINGSTVSLGGSTTVTATATNALTIGTGLSGTSYNGSTAVTIANTGVLSFSGGTTGLTPSAATTGAVTLAGTLAVANGGTGATTAAAALTNLGAYPASNPNGYTSNTGTVTSVTVSGGTTGLTTSGGPVTTSGTITLAGTLGISNGGTGQTTAQAAMNAFAGAVTSGLYLRGNGTNVVMSAIQAADVPTLNQNTTGNAATATTATNVSGGSANVTTLTTSSTVTLNGGTANGVAYLNASKVLTTGSALTFDGANLNVSGKYGVTGNGNTPTSTALEIGTNGAGSRWLYNVPTGGEHNFTVNGAVASWVGATSSGWLISGSEQMRLTSTGLGIGTSLPGAKIEVAGGGIAIANNQQLLWRTSGGTLAQLLKLNASNQVEFGDSQTSSVAMMLANGNLGLGVTPSAWGSGFRALQVGSGLSPSVSYINGFDAALNSYYDGTNWKYILSGYNAGRYTIFGSASGNSSHAWFTAGTGTAGNAISFTQAMTLDASGNFALGTTTANRRLEVSGAASGETYQMRIGAGASNNAYTYDIGRSTVDGYFRFYGNQTGATGYIFGGVDGERARIDSSGNFLVGTTTAAFSTGTGIFVKNPGGAATYIGINHNTGSSTGNDYVAFGYNGSQIGGIAQNGTAGVLYNITSDYRLKNVLGAVTGAGARIDALEPIEYEWKSDGTRTRGFLAHKFQEVYPHSVTGEKDAVDAEGNPVYQQMQGSTNEVIADLVAELQSLRKRLAAAGIA